MVEKRAVLMVLLGVFVFGYVMLAGSLVLRGGQDPALLLYTRNKQVSDTLDCKALFSGVFLRAAPCFYWRMRHRRCRFLSDGCVGAILFRIYFTLECI